jgi:hypothetical protein
MFRFRMRATMFREICWSGIVGAWILAMFSGSVSARADDADHIRPYSKNPYYWQYQGKPVLLLGGSWQDNLFNHPIGLEQHLDLLVSVGGNYVRNTMSHRNQGNVFAYIQRAGPGIPLEEDGKFDLDVFNEDYWLRLDDFLRMTHERDIIVQIEVFDPHDHFRDHQSLGGWSKHPFNPANNVNYTAEESGLPTEANYRPVATPSKHPFWLAVPALENNELVLRYQRAYVDKLLSITLSVSHVLYSIQNESGEELAFGDYWADYIHRRAREAGRTVFVTDMRRTGDVREPDQRHIMNQPSTVQLPGHLAECRELRADARCPRVYRQQPPSDQLREALQHGRRGGVGRPHVPLHLRRRSECPLPPAPSARGQPRPRKVKSVGAGAEPAGAVDDPQRADADRCDGSVRLPTAERPARPAVAERGVLPC